MKADIVIASALCVASATAVSAPAAAISLTPVLEGTKPSDSPTIVGGRKADPLRYPVSFQFKVSETEVCTWFLVSSRVLATAGHCVTEGLVVKLSIRGGKDHPETGGMSYQGTCSRSPASLDWALCLLDQPFPLPSDKSIRVTGYEVLNSDPARVRPGTEVEITGFGCITAGAAAAGVYMVGNSAIEKLPPDAVVPGSTDSAPNLIEIIGQPSIPCRGDSGGPAFISADPGTSNIRIVIGINSKTVNQDGIRLGYLSSTSTNAVAAWLRKWSNANGQRICGIHADAKGCRPTE